MKTYSMTFGVAVVNPKPFGEIVVEDAMTESERNMQDKIDAIFALGGLPGFAAMVFEKIWQPSPKELTRRWNAGEFRTLRRK
jgi:hypothetical protein